MLFRISALTLTISSSAAQGPGGPPSNGPAGPPSNGPGGPIDGLGAQGGSPSYPLYSQSLPLPQVARPSLVQKTDGRIIEFYNVTIEPFQQQIFPGLGPANLLGYNAMTPGPTYRIQRGHETVIRYLNNGVNGSAVHLHGSYTHAPWDGWASDEIQPGSFKDYYYPNTETARSIWYHDHAIGITSINAYQGQTGVYIIHDAEEEKHGLPSGKFDVPLMLMDKTYQSNGDLALPNSVFNFYGDTNHVNGMPWPYFNVEPRRYRFRIYDTALSRPYDLVFIDGQNQTIPFEVIGSDAGLFGRPVTTSDVLISNGERYEVVFDFSNYAGQEVLLNNAYSDSLVANFNNTDKVMKFVVGTEVTNNLHNGPVPAILNDKIAWPHPRTTVDHVFDFRIGGDNLWTINGIDFSDVNNRVLARPPQGAVERWQLVHSGGPGLHPVHVHLVDFQVVNRTGGSRGVLPYEAAGLKDIVLLEPGETVDVLARYAPWNGLYMFHCHNLIHEDHQMLDAFNVTKLSSLGYEFDSTLQFADPNDKRFSAQKYSAEAYEPNSIFKAVHDLAALRAYGSVEKILQAEREHFAKKPFNGEPETGNSTANSSATGSPTVKAEPASATTTLEAEHTKAHSGSCRVPTHAPEKAVDKSPSAATEKAPKTSTDRTAERSTAKTSAHRTSEKSTTKTLAKTTEKAPRHTR